MGAGIPVGAVASHLLRERQDVDRLADVVREAGGAEPLRLGLERCQRDQRYPGGSRFGSQFAGHVRAVHVRKAQIQIQKNNLRQLGERDRDCLATVSRLERAEPRAAQHVTCGLEVPFVVVDDRD